MSARISLSLCGIPMRARRVVGKTAFIDRDNRSACRLMGFYAGAEDTPSVFFRLRVREGFLSVTPRRCGPNRYHVGKHQSMLPVLLKGIVGHVHWGPERSCRFWWLSCRVWPWERAIQANGQPRQRRRQSARQPGRSSALRAHVSPEPFDGISMDKSGVFLKACE